MDIAQTIVGRELLRAEVSRRMFCQLSGKVLDVKTAILLEINFATSKLTAYIVVHQSQRSTVEKWAVDFAADKDIASVVIYHGRQLFP